MLQRSELLSLGKMTDEELEYRVMSTLTDGGHPKLKLLWDQFQCSAVTSRDVSNVGMFTKLSIDKELVKAFDTDFKFGDVIIDTDDLDYGAGVIVYVINGYLSLIEFYSFGDSWSYGYPNLQLQYIQQPRDLSNIS